MKFLNRKKIYILSLILSILLVISGCEDVSNEVSELEDDNPSEEVTSIEDDESDGLEIEEDGEYSDPDRVALYIHTYGKLPKNYLTKKEASDLGWVAREGNLWEVTDKMSIGGDRFGNREGLLPEKEGRQYYECDVNYQGGTRGPERLVYSNDGLIFYTEDHYNSFIEIYGDE